LGNNNLLQRVAHSVLLFFVKLTSLVH
jgi:hypothetical protein